MSEQGFSIEIRFEKWVAPNSQGERDSGIKTQRETIRAHYNGSLSEAEATELFDKLDAVLKADGGRR